VDRDCLERTLWGNQIYICGPEKFVEETNLILKDFGFAEESNVHEEQREFFYFWSMQYFC